MPDAAVGPGAGPRNANKSASPKKENRWCPYHAGMGVSEEDLLRAVAGTMSDVCWIASRDLSRVHYVNPRFEQLSGDQRSGAGERADARSFHRGMHPDDRVRIEQSYQRDSASLDHEYRLVTPDGSTRWIRERGSAVVVVAQDITEVKQTAADRDSTVDRFRIISRAMNEGMWDWDIASNVAWYNDAMYSVYGIPPGITPSFETWSQRVHPGDRERVLAGFRQVAEGGAETWADEYRFVRPDGRELEIFDRGFVIYDDQRRPVRMVGVVMDITQQRALERQLRHAQKMEAVGQFAGGIAHDFNNILQAAKLEMNLLRRAPDIGRQVLAHAAEVETALDRATSLTRQLLVFSRLEAMQLQAVELNSMVAKLARMLRRVLGEQISLEIEPGHGPIPVTADPSMLDQVLINLAINARDAMRGSGKLSIATSVCDQVARPGGEPGRYARITVTDTGVGIAPEIIPRIFEPFFTTKESSGTGLGLATVHGIVHQHQGWIDVESEPERGATFHVYLPALAATVAPQVETSRPVESRGKESILVVEDDAAVRRAVCSLLARHGYSVTEAESGAAAIAAWDACDGAIDLVYTDLVMPGGINGEELATLLLARRPGLKVIIATGYGALERGNAGASYELLHKPVEADRLLSAVRTCLDR